MIQSTLKRVDPEHRAMLFQLARYAFAGFAITLLVAASYWAIAEYLRVAIPSSMFEYVRHRIHDEVDVFIGCLPTDDAHAHRALSTPRRAAEERFAGCVDPGDDVVGAIAESKQTLIDDWNGEHFRAGKRTDARDDVVRVPAAALDEIGESVASEEAQRGVGWK